VGNELPTLPLPDHGAQGSDTMTRRRIVRSALLLAILGAGGSFYWLLVPFREARSLQRGYDKVQRGMPLATVEAVMGTKGTSYSGPYRAWWDDQRLDETERQRIRSALRYRVETFFLAVTFEITFGHSGTVLGKHRYD